MPPRAADRRGLASREPETLGNPAPFSPGDNRDETIGTLLMAIAWHQAYHVGHTGLLRRLAGSDGAIRWEDGAAPVHPPAIAGEH